MSLFVHQQNLPFTVVSPFLRLYQPATAVEPGDWARNQVAGYRPGDMLFLLEPHYSPWSGIGSDIGVSEGDTFKIVRLILILRASGEHGTGYALEPESYEHHDIEQYLQQQVQAANAASTGFYYLLFRPASQITSQQSQSLSELECYGSSGWRTADADSSDLPVAFLAAAGVQAAAPGGSVLDFAHLGCLILTDREPPPGSCIPDLRGLYAPVAVGDEGDAASSASPQGESGQPPVKEAAPPGFKIPKALSFLSKQQSSGGPPAPPPAIKAPGAVRRIIPPKGMPPAAPLAGWRVPAASQAFKEEPAAGAQQDLMSAMPESSPQASREDQVQVQVQVQVPAIVTDPSLQAWSEAPIPPAPAPPQAQSWSEAPAAQTQDQAQSWSEAPIPPAPGSLDADVEIHPAVSSSSAPGSLLATPLPPKKKKIEDATRAQQLQALAQLNEPVGVRSGVAGLVSKLELQANKASGRLETQVEEIQSRLNSELSKLLEKVAGIEKRSTRSTEGLRMNLTTKMDAACNEVKTRVSEASAEGSNRINQFIDNGLTAVDEKHEELRISLKASFDGVREHAENAAKEFDETSNQRSEQSKSLLNELMASIEKQFSDWHSYYLQELDSTFNHFKQRLESVLTGNTDAISKSFESFSSEIGELDERSRGQLRNCRDRAANGLSRRITAAEQDIMRLKAVSVTESTIPKLKEYRDMLKALGQEMQHQLGSDLESKGVEKIAALEPVLNEKKQILMELLAETDWIKRLIQERLRGELDDVFGQLKSFVDGNIDQAKRDFQRTEDEVAEIDRSVRALADPSSIEGDLDLLTERNTVLEKLSECGETATEEVLTVLRLSVASLEEKGKQLQEELITTMEEDAYVVRRSSEQALVRIREAIKDAFQSIQAAQDERME